MNEIIAVDKKTGEIYVTKETMEIIRNYEVRKKELDEEYKQYKKALLDAMEEYGVEKVDSEDLLVTYVGETERVSVDSKKLEKEFPEVYAQCLKVSTVKPSVRVKIRK